MVRSRGTNLAGATIGVAAGLKYETVIAEVAAAYEIATGRRPEQTDGRALLPVRPRVAANSAARCAHHAWSKIGHAQPVGIVAHI